MNNTRDEKKPNIAFLDGQNLYYGTTKCFSCARKLKKELKAMRLSDCQCSIAWEINFKKFRIYLKENYNVSEAYYFIGFLKENNNDLYNNLQKAGFIVQFKEHKQTFASKKKGNVDTDIVFEVMKKLLENQEEFDKIVLVSGDGDYKKLVDYLILKNKFKKILFPNRKFASSLYDELGSEMFDYLDGLKTYIE